MMTMRPASPSEYRAYLLARGVTASDPLHYQAGLSDCYVFEADGRVLAYGGFGLGDGFQECWFASTPDLGERGVLLGFVRQLKAEISRRHRNERDKGPMIAHVLHANRHGVRLVRLLGFCPAPRKPDYLEETTGLWVFSG